MCLLTGYELGLYIPDDGIHSHYRENIESYNMQIISYLARNKLSFGYKEELVIVL
jgi:hypothetical protein